MQPVITLFKTEFLAYSQLCDQLGILPNEVVECEFFYLYTPPSSKLSHVLKVLRQNKVNHGIQFANWKPQDRRSDRKVVHQDQGILI
jgi:hypothetical protein